MVRPTRRAAGFRLVERALERKRERERFSKPVGFNFGIGFAECGNRIVELYRAE